MLTNKKKLRKFCEVINLKIKKKKINDILNDFRYYPQEKYSEVDRSGNEFDNPLYKQTAANKERLQRGSAFKENHSDDTTLSKCLLLMISYHI